MFITRDLDSLLKVFDIDKKKDLLNYCKNLVIYSCDFASLIMACEAADVGYQHQISYRDFVPEHLVPTDEDFGALSKSSVGKLNGKAGKFATKVSQIFKDRRYLVGHIFFTNNLKYWHFFYFDQRDLSDYGNHWHKGSHIHFLNYLWTGYTAQSVWDHFTKGNPQMKGSIHIQYIELRHENA